MVVPTNYSQTSGGLISVAPNLTQCLDLVGRWVTSGEAFTPLGSDPCTMCTCFNGTIQACKSAWCNAPPCENYRQVENECCKFVCLGNPKTPDTPMYQDHYDKSTSGTFDDDALTAAGVRMIASTVTCLLILVVIVFLMNKLRRHRLSLNIHSFRRRNARSNAEVVSYVANYDDVDTGLRCSHVTSEAPPPYVLLDEDLPPPPYIQAAGSASTPDPKTQQPSQGLIPTGAPAQASSSGLESPPPDTTTSCNDCSTATGNQGSRLSVSKDQSHAVDCADHLCSDETTQSSVSLLDYSTDPSNSRP